MENSPKPGSPVVLRGLPPAPGLAQGRAVLWNEETLRVPRYAIADAEGELKRLTAAREEARAELSRLQEKVSLEASAEEADVFKAHRMFLDDKALLKKV